MFGTKNQKRPTNPFVYAFSVDTNIAGAQIHVAAILKADIIQFSLRLPTQNLSTFFSFFVNISVAVIIITA